MLGFLFDSNLWVALAFAAHPFHRSVGEVLKRASADQPVCRLRATEMSALRLVSTPTIHRAFGVPHLSNREAIDYLVSLFDQTGCVEIEEPEGTRSLWLRLAADFQRFGQHGLSVTLLE